MEPAGLVRLAGGYPAHPAGGDLIAGLTVRAVLAQGPGWRGQHPPGGFLSPEGYSSFLGAATRF
jgi:hypothetical protein